jgi:hypothetical protein
MTTIDMDNSKMLLFLIITVTVGLSLFTASPVKAATKVTTGTVARGPVIQEQPNTGDPTLDKEINKFYSCISRMHQDPPTRQIVDNCYYQTSIGGIHSSGNSVHTHTIAKDTGPPPGVLVEVP